MEMIVVLVACLICLSQWQTADSRGGPDSNVVLCFIDMDLWKWWREKMFRPVAEVVQDCI